MRKIACIKVILFLLGLNFFNTNNLVSKNNMFRRIRDIRTKEEIVVDYFIKQLRNKLDNKILGIYLVPKQLMEEEEGIDVVIIYNGIERNGLLDVATEITFHLADEYGEIILPYPISKEEILYRQKYIFYYFPLWEILQAGSCLHLNLQGKELFVDASEKYINLAKEKLNEGNFNDSFLALYRTALILLNAAVGREERYSSERGDIFEQFRKSFILTNKVPADWSEKINSLIELKEILEQNPNTVIHQKNLTSLMDFLRNLYLHVRG